MDGILNSATSTVDASNGWADDDFDFDGAFGDMQEGDKPEHEEGTIEKSGIEETDDDKERDQVLSHDMLGIGSIADDSEGQSLTPLVVATDGEDTRESLDDSEVKVECTNAAMEEAASAWDSIPSLETATQHNEDTLASMFSEVPVANVLEKATDDNEEIVADSPSKIAFANAPETIGESEDITANEPFETCDASAESHLETDSSSTMPQRVPETLPAVVGSGSVSDEKEEEEDVDEEKREAEEPAPGVIDEAIDANIDEESQVVEAASIDRKVEETYSTVHLDSGEQQNVLLNAESIGTGILQASGSEHTVEIAPLSSPEEDQRVEEDNTCHEKSKEVELVTSNSVDSIEQPNPPLGAESENGSVKHEQPALDSRGAQVDNACIDNSSAIATVNRERAEDVAQNGAHDDSSRMNLPELYRQKVIAIYQEHNPEKLGDLEPIFRKAVGKEKGLYEAVCKKFSLVPEILASKDMSDVDVPKQRNSEELDSEEQKQYYRDKIVAIYQVHNPAKLGELQTIMETYSGKERKLYDAVCRKFSIDPAIGVEKVQAISEDTPGESSHCGAYQGMDVPQEPRSTTVESSDGKAEDQQAPGNADDQEEDEKDNMTVKNADQQDEGAESHGALRHTDQQDEEEQSNGAVKSKESEEALGNEVDQEAIERREYYREQIIAVYEEHNPAKISEVDGMLDKYAGKERRLYEAICRKYMREIEEEPSTADTASAEEATSTLGFSSWLKTPGVGSLAGVGSLGVSFSASGAGFLQSGLSTLQTMKDAAEGLQGAAEGLREKVERSFDEAIRTETDLENSYEEVLESLQSGQAVISESITQSSEVEGASHDDAEKPCDEVSTSEEIVRTEDGTIEGGDLAERAAKVEELEKVQRLFEEREKAQLMEFEAKTTKLVALATEQRNELKRLSTELERSKVQLQREQKESDRLRTQTQKEHKEDVKRLQQQHKDEIKKMQTQHASEVDKAWAQLQREQSQHDAERETRKQRTSEHDVRIKALEEALETAAREREELIQTNQSISAEHRRTLADLDTYEKQLEDQKSQSEKAMEQQKKKLEAIERDFAQQSLPYTRQIADLEGKIAKQEQRMNEREIAVQRALAMAESKESALQKDLQGKAEREAREQQEKAQREATAAAEAEAMQRERIQSKARIEAAQKTCEVAERKRDEVETELKLEVTKRVAEERKVGDLTDKLEEVSRQLQQAKQLATINQSTAKSVPSLMPAPASPSVNGQLMSAKELEDDSRRLRAEIQALTRQRESLETEASRLQNHIDAMQKKAGAANGSRGDNSSVLEQKFEAALQMIGRLSDELEESKAQRMMLEVQLSQKS